MKIFLKADINIRKKTTTTVMVQMMVKGLKDFGLDAQNRKLQAFDEMDYEDGCEVEVRDGDLTDGDEVENGKDDALGVVDAIDEKSESPLEEAGDLPKPRSEEKDKSGATIKKEVRAQLVRKETDRSIFVSANGFQGKDLAM
ncbi:hypothetical protein ACFX14_014281 [Malus domestica]